MATPLCKITVMKIYEDVIDDVIKGVQELFLEDGVDEHVLQELRQTWKTKLLATKAVHSLKANDGDNITKQTETTFHQPQMVKQVIKPLPQNNNNQIPQVVANTLVPIQITLPAQLGHDVGRQITIQVPVSSLQGNQLQKVLTGPLIAATMSLPPQVAASVLQQHVTAGLKSLEQASLTPSNQVLQTDGVMDSSDDESLEKAGTAQVDGPQDSSDDEVSEESADIDDDKDEEEDEIDEGGPEDDPLNSDDDISEEESSDVIDTDNVVVCQFDKITRARNKWKFHFKDGIMNINGEDYVFQKATGDAEW